MSHTDRDIAFLLGLPFNVITMDETIEDAVNFVEARTPSYIITANADFIAQAYQNKPLRDILFHADRAVCDGMPLVWLSRIFKPELPERVAGSDLVFRLFGEANARGWKVYFLGSDDETLTSAKSILKKDYPNMDVVGTFSPPFGAVEDWPNEAILADVKATAPDLLLVAVGCPKQEYWICKYKKEAGVPLSLGIGASLDFICGRQVRAPMWVQKVGMEWLWRLLGNPQRLFKRYAMDFYYLFRLSFLQWRLTSNRKYVAVPAVAAAPVERGQLRSVAHYATHKVYYWHGEVGQASLGEAERPSSYDGPVFLDLADVTFMDSSGIGHLAQVARAARQHGVPFALINPSKTVSGIIKAMRLDSQFPSYANEAEAIATCLIPDVAPEGVVVRRIALLTTFKRSGSKESVAALEDAVSSLADGVWLTVDLKELDFIDSFAISCLLSAFRKVKAKGGQLRIENIQPVPEQAMRLMRVYDLLTKGAAK